MSGTITGFVNGGGVDNRKQLKAYVYVTVT